MSVSNFLVYTKPDFKISHKDKEDILNPLKSKLDIDLNSLRAVESWKERIKEVLNNAPLSAASDRLFDTEASELRKAFNRPEKISLEALRILRPEMKSLLERKVRQLEFTVECEQMLEMIPESHKTLFLTAMHERYQMYIEAQISPQRAFVQALGYVLSRSMINPQDVKDETLKPYKCGISGKLIYPGNALFIEADQHGNPIARYNCAYLEGHNKKLRLGSIQTDVHCSENVEKILGPLLYPLQNPSKLSSFSEAFSSSYFLAAHVGYSIAQDAYRAAITRGEDYNQAAAEAEKIEILAIMLLEPFLREVPKEALKVFSWKPFSEATTQRDQDAQPVGFSLFSPPSYVEPSDEKSLEWKDRIFFMKEFLIAHVCSMTSSSTASLSPLQDSLDCKMDQYLKYVKDCKNEDPKKKREMLQTILRQMNLKKRQGDDLESPPVVKKTGFEERSALIRRFFR